MNRILAAGAAVLSIVLAHPASACEGASVLYEADFSAADPAWGNYSDLKIANGVLTILVNPGNGYPLQLQGRTFDGNYDICVDVVQKNTEPSAAWASLLFWGIDYENYYLLQATTDGYVNAARRQNGQWTNPVEWLQTPAVNPGTMSNTLRVVIEGSRVTGFVNGQQVAQFNGEPPSGGGLIGVYGNAPAGAPASYDFRYFKVTEVD
jgi:hypothetical protein